MNFLISFVLPHPFQDYSEANRQYTGCRFCEEVIMISNLKDQESIINGNIE